MFLYQQPYTWWWIKAGMGTYDLIGWLRLAHGADKGGLGILKFSVQYGVNFFVIFLILQCCITVVQR